MVLNNRAIKSNIKESTLSSEKNTPNISGEESTKQKRLRQYFQKRGVAILAIVVCILFLAGSNSSSSPFSINDSKVVTKSASASTGNTEIDIETTEEDLSYIQTSYEDNSDKSSTQKFETENDILSTKDTESIKSLSSPNGPTCSKPRSYPELKYYQINSKLDDQPSFLTTDAAYIRGKSPFILRPTFKKKICIDSSSWDSHADNKLPFSDGQNPSIMSLSTLTDPLTNTGKPRLTNMHTIDPILTLIGGIGPAQNMFAGVIYVGGAQCGYGMSKEEKEEFHISDLDKPPVEQSLFLILDQNFDTVLQTTILLERDVEEWGKIKFKGYNLNDRKVEKLDDPRLFFYKGEMWVLFRNGKAFGFEKQIHNKLHFDLVKEDGEKEQKLIAYIKASETVTTCCGRNMAMVSQPSDDTLKTVTWVDPMTVDIAIGESSQSQPSLRKLAKQAKSNIHGTNGYMIPLYETHEYGGIAHFHRPENRDTNPYALHGHHYTHAFFTMSMTEPHVLKRISNEFVFEALHPAKDGMDGEVIQFASGVDIIQKTRFLSSAGTMDVKNELIVSYGINDCESAVASFDLNSLPDLLIDVDGLDVVDLMEKRSDL